MILEKVLKDENLRRFWQACFHDKKISKQEILRLPIRESIRKVMSSSSETISFRLQTVLLLGFMKVMQRKMEYSVREAEDMVEKLSCPYTREKAPPMTSKRKRELDIEGIGESSVREIMEARSPISGRISSIRENTTGRGTPGSDNWRIAGAEETLERTPYLHLSGELGELRGDDAPLEDLFQGGKSDTNFLLDLQRAEEVSLHSTPFSSRLPQHNNILRELTGDRHSRGLNNNSKYDDDVQDTLFGFMHSMRGEGVGLFEESPAHLEILGEILGDSATLLPDDENAINILGEMEIQGVQGRKSNKRMCLTSAQLPEEDEELTEPMELGCPKFLERERLQDLISSLTTLNLKDSLLPRRMKGRLEAEMRDCVQTSVTPFPLPIRDQPEEISISAIPQIPDISAMEELTFFGGMEDHLSNSLIPPQGEEGKEPDETTFAMPTPNQLSMMGEDESIFHMDKNERLSQDHIGMLNSIKRSIRGRNQIAFEEVVDGLNKQEKIRGFAEVLILAQRNFIHPTQANIFAPIIINVHHKQTSIQQTALIFLLY